MQLTENQASAGAQRAPKVGTIRLNGPNKPRVNNGHRHFNLICGTKSRGNCWNSLEINTAPWQRSSTHSGHLIYAGVG